MKQFKTFGNYFVVTNLDTGVEELRNVVDNIYYKSVNGNAHFYEKSTGKTESVYKYNHTNTVNGDDGDSVFSTLNDLLLYLNDSTGIKDISVGEEPSAQNPLPTDGDSVYVKDIDVANSDNGNFSNEVIDLFDSLKTVNVDNTANNPKSFKVWFERTIQTSSIGFGCDDLTKSFSNIVIKALGSGEEVRYVNDMSSDNTKRNSYLVQLPPLALNGIIIEFHTSDEVALSNLIIFKSTNHISRQQAVKPDGTVTNIGATNNDNLRVSINEYGDTPSVDAFARLRVSDNFTIFDSKQLHDKQPLFWDEEIGGSGTSTHVPVDASTNMVVTANAADYVIRQTKQRYNYQPGKSQLIFMTFRSPQESGLTKQVGIFDGTGVNFLTPNNGIFFECDGTVSWNICKNGITTEKINQSNWNVDKLDGTGASGITLDLNAAQILIIDYEWLGVGRVRVGFVIDGLIYYVHYFNHANNPSFEKVYMSSPNLPLRYTIQTDGSAGGEMDHICSSVISEGGIEKTGVLRTAKTGVTAIATNTIGTTYAIIGIRLKNIYKDITIIPESLSLMVGTNDRFQWSLHINPVISGTFTYNGLPNSAVEAAIGTSANEITDVGIEEISGYTSSNSREVSEALNTALRIGEKIDGTKDTLVLAITPITSNMSTHGSLNFRELL